MVRARHRREMEIRAEAAAWLARIHSDDARESDIADFQLWVAEDARHQQAFASVTSVWEAVGGVDKLDNGLGPLRHPKPRSFTSRRAVVFTAGVAGVIAGIWKFSRSTPRPETQPLETYTTPVGEQRRVALSDGSLAILDTDSSIAVDFRDGKRMMHQLKGRANFEVAHDPVHPFIVYAGDVSVVALGTSFDVSSSANSVGVVLINGKIRITPIAVTSPELGLELHSPGEHIVISGQRVLLRDRSDLSVATAWQDGRVVFNNETLAEAVAKMNRYTRRPIVLSPDIVQLRISGNYRTGDSEAFATSLAELLPLTATFEPAQILLKAKDANEANSN
jgi:transmembrane sensor